MANDGIAIAATEISRAMRRPRSPLRPLSDHPARALVSSVQAQSARLGGDDGYEVKQTGIRLTEETSRNQGGFRRWSRDRRTYLSDFPRKTIPARTRGKIIRCMSLRRKPQSSVVLRLASGARRAQAPSDKRLAKSVRALVLLKVGERAFFVHGFAKSDRDNIRDDELVALKKLAGELLNYDDAALAKAIAAGVLMEVVQ
jgi:hypothetical protein